VRKSLVLVLGLLCACTKRGNGADDAPVAPLAAVSEDAVVATVDGRPIYATAVAAQAKARGVDVKTALSDLIDAESLAGEAHRRGLDRALDVRLATKGALVRRYLQTTFEHDVTPADVPADRIRRAYVRNQAQLNHDIYIDVVHILVPVGEKPTEARKAEAKALAEQLAAVGKKMTQQEFMALPDTMVFNGQPLPKAEELLTEKDGWTQKSFSYGAFEKLHKRGDTCVVETTFGWHALYMLGFKPAVHTPIAAVEGELRRGLFESEVQKLAFGHFMDEAMARHRLELHQDRLPKDKNDQDDAE
jgi:hypothetical protein